jgi:CheY-like chemotaxis protein
MCHVLIIEDDWFIGEEIECMALANGATTVDRAETEVIAVALAFANRPAVILSDVCLLEGTGPEAVVTIQNQLGPIPVIFITATPEACGHCAYASAILRKPMVSTEVSRAFTSVVPV